MYIANNIENDVCFSHLLYILLILLTKVRTEANSLDPDQTAPQSDLGLQCLAKRPLKDFSKCRKQANFVVIGI